MSDFFSVWKIEGNLKSFFGARKMILTLLKRLVRKFHNHLWREKNYIDTVEVFIAIFS